VTELRTARLVLRPLAPTDASWLHETFNYPAVRRWLWDDRMVAAEEVEEILAESRRRIRDDGTGLWVAREGVARVGFSGFWPFHDDLELLYGLDPEHFGRGLATEMAGELLRYGFEELKMARVVGSTDPPNQPSVRVMERLGMRHTETRTVEGLETAFYAIEREAWLRGRSS